MAEADLSTLAYKEVLQVWLNSLAVQWRGFSVRQRNVMFLLGLGGAFFLLQNSPVVIVIGVATVFCWGLGLRAKYLFQKIRRPLVRKIWRIVAGSRRMLAVTPEVEFLHIASILLMVGALPYFVVTKDLVGLGVAWTAATIFLCGAALVDTGRQIMFLANRAWAKIVGKLVLAGIGFLLVYVAGAIANHVTHAITHADPKYFPDFVGFLTAVITPFLYLALGSTAAMAWAFLQLVMLSLVMLIGDAVGRVSPIFNRALYRISTGRRALPGYRKRFDESSFVSIMRPVSLMLTVMVMWSLFGSLSHNYGSQVERSLIRLLVLLEYKSGSMCEGLARDAEVAYLDRGYISVAEPTEKTVKFSVRQCSPVGS